MEAWDGLFDIWDLELSIVEHSGIIYLDMKSDIYVNHKNIRDIFSKLVWDCDISVGSINQMFLV